MLEIPKGSMNKYNNTIKLDRVLFSPLHYPGDYGLIPRTLGDDGDPLDALVLVTNPTYPGVLIESRPIGLLRMNDSDTIDDKILCVPISDPRYDSLKNIDDIEKHTLKEMAHFFQVYKDLEGKKVEIVGWYDISSAKEVIVRSMRLYSERFKR